MVVLFKFFCILLPSLLKTNVCFYHIYLFKLREAKVEETEIIDNIESWRRLLHRAVFVTKQVNTGNSDVQTPHQRLIGIEGSLPVKDVDFGT